MTHWNSFLGTSAAFIVFAVHAQQPMLPKELSGRYSVVGGTFSQAFSLQDISLDTDKTFKAKLTWWTRDPKCVLRGEPVVGRLTETGIAFDAKTKCDVPFSAELNRTEKEWTGKAATTEGPQISLELKAN